ncbi:unnamed protein product [Soboliphyme baturini]|uniref:HOOK_N domain-containing protein n=1 Tax=Soboliphyme baturini TaxID=241478 RepID=A0A183J1P6_9BILA|nr:unnamed protein product [Soboliphyme baturini]
MIGKMYIPDAVLATRDENKVELTKMMKIILAAAVGSPRGKEVIEKIMTLQKSIQQIVMMSIKELDDTKVSLTAEPIELFDVALFENSNASEVSGSPKVLQADLNEAMEKCEELENQVSALQKEKHHILQENESLKAKVFGKVEVYEEDE